MNISKNVENQTEIYKNDQFAVYHKDPQPILFTEECRLVPYTKQMLNSDMHHISSSFASDGVRKKSPTPLKMINFDMQADLK